MREAVIVSTARTPIGKAYKGAFHDTQPQALAAHAISAALTGAGVERGEVEDVVLGSAMQEGASGFNVGRQAALRAGLPTSVAGMTVDRQCASGLMAVSIAAKQVIADGMDIVVGGGVESISLVQNEHRNLYRAQDPWLVENGHDIYISMLETAETVAQRYGVTREAQDEYALESQKRTAAAQEKGLFSDEIAPFESTRVFSTEEGPKTRRSILSLDEGNRPNTTLEGLASLHAVLPDRPDHLATITAGNASQLSDGAAAVVVMEAKEAARRNLEPLGTYRGECGRGLRARRDGHRTCFRHPEAAQAARPDLR